MEKSLTLKQHQVLEKFKSKLTLHKIKTNSFSIFQRNKNFTMAAPSVYKIEGTDSHLIFGDFMAYDFEKIKQQLEQIQQMQQSHNMEDMDSLKKIIDQKSVGLCEEMEEPEETDNEKKVGLNMGDTVMREEAIELIMDQNGVSRFKAIAVLTECEFDVLKATEMLERERK